MRTVGTLLLIIGLIGTIFYGVKAIQASESFTFLGMDVAVSSANWTPVIISVIILLVGFFLRKKG